MPDRASERHEIFMGAHAGAPAASVDLRVLAAHVAKQVCHFLGETTIHPVGDGKCCGFCSMGMEQLMLLQAPFQCQV
jgi:hypothetical protein